MLTVARTEIFASWLAKLADRRGKAAIIARIDRLAAGNVGDVKPVGEGISEMRLDFGPGYRLYFVQRGKELVVLLCGGDKSSQSKDIAAAKRMAREV